MERGCDPTKRGCIRGAVKIQSQPEEITPRDSTNYLLTSPCSVSIQIWYSSHPIRVCSRLTRERCQTLLFRASLFSIFHSLQIIWDLASSVSAGTIGSFLLLRVPCCCIVHLSPMGLVCKRVYIKMRVRNQGLATLAFGGVNFQPHQDQLDPTLHVFKERDHG